MQLGTNSRSDKKNDACHISSKPQVLQALNIPYTFSSL